MALGLQGSFSYGEVAPGLRGRVDTELYRSALGQAHNVIIDVLGGVRKRPPLRFTPYVGIRLSDRSLIPYRPRSGDMALWQLTTTGIKEQVRFRDGLVLAGEAYELDTGTLKTQDEGLLVTTQVAEVVTITNAALEPLSLYRDANSGAVMKALVPAALQKVYTEFGNPTAIAYFQQRFVIAGSTSRPNSLYASQVGRFSDFSVSTPVVESDAVAVTLASKRLDRVTQLAELKRLIIFTEGGEWEVTGQLTPTAIAVDQISAWGSTTAHSVVDAQDFVLFITRDNRIRAMELNQYDNLKSHDLTLHAHHLFRDRQIRRMAHNGRYLVVVFSDGTAAVCTYNSETATPAWTTMDTEAGSFDDVFDMTVRGRSKFVFVVRHDRTEHRFLAEFDPDERVGPYCDQVDTLAATDVVQGYKDVRTLTAFEGVFSLYRRGHEVARVQSTQAPNQSPRLTLPAGADFTVPDEWLVGLPYSAHLETLDLSVSEAGQALGARQSVARVRVKLNESLGLLVGPHEDRMSSLRLRQFEEQGKAVLPYTGDVRLPIPREWRSNGRLRLESVGPYAMEVLSIIPDTQVGDE